MKKEGKFLLLGATILLSWHPIVFISTGLYYGQIMPLIVGLALGTLIWGFLVPILWKSTNG